MADEIDMDIDVLVSTRGSWHTVAEHVIAPARHAATGRIGLRATPGGFGTPPFPRAGGERQLLVVGDELIVLDGGSRRSAPLTTVRAAAELAEVSPGAPADVYTPTTPLDPDAPLAIDVDAAERLADWFALTDQALEVFRSEHAHEDPAVVQLWPEHFDLATTLPLGEGEGINFGGSPGDETHALPYLYVGPWRVPTGDFWNEPFGASRPWDEIRSVDDALAFFREGHALVMASR
jgi:hypothetical protein